MDQYEKIRPSEPTSVEIVYTEAEPKNAAKEQQKVTDPEIGDVVEKLKEQARLLSKLRRQVEKETVARNTGLTENRSQELSLKPTLRMGPEAQAAEKPAQPESDLQHQVRDDLALSANSGGGTAQGLRRQLRVGQSTSNDYIPHVEEGSFTALNTDQFTYYTFYKRINEQIYPRWVNNIKSIAYHSSPQRLSRLALYARTTELEIVLDRNGYHVRTDVLRSSGDQEVDMAAVEAMEAATPFLNPPMSLVDEDGHMYLQYSFVVRWKPTYTVRSRVHP